MIVLRTYEKFPSEFALLGKILLGYTDLEFELLECVRAIIGDDLDTAVEAMFRTRGETQRIAIADALARKKSRQLSINTEFEMAIADMHHCLKIRNQYSHCSWHNADDKALFFANLEELATQNMDVSGDVTVTFHQVDKVLLEKQYSYFEYVLHSLDWTRRAARSKLGLEKAALPPKRAQLPRPDFSYPQKK